MLSQNELEVSIGKQFIWYDIISDKLIKYSDGKILVWTQMSLKLNSMGLYYIEFETPQRVIPVMNHLMSWAHYGIKASIDRSLEQEIRWSRRKVLFQCDRACQNKITGIGGRRRSEKYYEKMYKSE